MHALGPRPRIGVSVQRSYEAGTLIIGIQERRVKEEQLRAGVCYQMVVAADSENGSSGVQAWFHKLLGPEFLAINVISPRLMAVAAKLNKLSVFDTLVVGHAPTSASDLEVRAIFLSAGDLVFQTRKEFPRATALLAVDANARVGSETCGT